MINVDWDSVVPAFSGRMIQKHPMTSEEFVKAGYRARDFSSYYRFMNRIRELGAKPAPDAIWRGIHKPFPLVCPVGHECTPHPSNVQKGRGLCRACARQDPATAEEYFRRQVIELGGTLLYDTWQGVHMPHHVRCAMGHDAFPKPNHVQQGCGICRACAGNDPSMAEVDFRRRVADLNGIPLYDTWQGVHMPHHVRCAMGHDAFPLPSNVQRGCGLCPQCRVNHNAIYVVSGRDTVKFGITSANPKPRLNDHKTDGFRDVLRLYTNLPEGVARTAEQQAIAACHDAGFQPVRGREYYHIAALSVILDVIDGHAEAAGAVNRVVCWDDVIANGEWSAALWLRSIGNR